MRSGLLGCMLAGALAYGTSANAIVITIDDLTGDDSQMLVTILDGAPGVTAEWNFSGGSANTGDLTGVWLGIVDTTFDTSSLSAAAVTILSGLPAGVTYTVHIGTAETLQNLGGGVNLEGQDGFALTFDFDLALSQNDAQSNDIVSSLKIGIATAGLTAGMFDAAGARVQSSTGTAGSSKLAGGRVVEVPEPATLSMLGVGLLLLGFGRRRRQYRA